MRSAPPIPDMARLHDVGYERIELYDASEEFEDFSHYLTPTKRQITKQRPADSPHHKRMRSALSRHAIATVKKLDFEWSGEREYGSNIDQLT